MVFTHFLSHRVMIYETTDHEALSALSTKLFYEKDKSHFIFNARK
jgi:hypothetical protein